MADDELKDLDIDLSEYPDDEAEEVTEEAEQGGEAETEDEEGVDVVLEGEEKHSTEQAAQKGKKSVTVPASTLAKLRETRREARNENDELKQQLEKLRQQVSLGGSPKPKGESAMPTLASVDYDESAYAAKLTEWQNEQMQKQMQSYHSNIQQQQAQKARQEAAEREITQHYERAASLKVDGYEDAERNVRTVLGSDVADQMIAFLGEGSEKVTFHLGKNPEALNDLVATLQQDPSGMRAMVKLGELRGRLKVKPKTNTISGAPAADEALNSGGSGSSEKSVVSKLEKLHKRTDLTDFRRLKKQLVAAGKSDLLKKHGFI